MVLRQQRAKTFLPPMCKLEVLGGDMYVERFDVLVEVNALVAGNLERHLALPHAILS